MNERIQNELNKVRYKRIKRREENPLEYIKELMMENERYRRFYINAVKVADKRLEKIKELKERIKELESHF